MFLKKIEISGFKSFAQKTVLDFSERGVSSDFKKQGITAIVGPNGSGKSNIVDALRWTLGEQSMKNLRGKKTLDVIFAGSDKKARLGSAQVSIFLDNSSRKVAVDFPEVIITRRIYRSGESEYLINGSPARLSDVVDLLASVGIGQHSYCLVNQGMADRILKATPLERRSIIEEAAGVKEFQLKKERSERKLKSTSQNLERVANLLLEIEPHLKNLKKQNQKLENGRAYREKLIQKRKELFGFLLFDFDEKGNFLKEKKAELEKQLDSKNESSVFETDFLKQEEKSKKDYRKDIFSLEEEVRKLQSQASSWERDIFLLEGKISLEKEKMKSFNLAEIIPVDLVFVKNNLQKIQKIQSDFLLKLKKINSLKELEKLKEIALKIKEDLEDLINNVEKGKIEKRKPSQELEILEKEALKKIEKIFQEKKILEEKRKAIFQKIQNKKDEVKNLIEKEKEENALKMEKERKRQEEMLKREKQKEELNELRIELARIETRKEDLLKRIFLETGWTEKDLEEIKREFHQKIEISQWEMEISRLKLLVDQSGSVDESVVEEYKEAKIRFDFLTKEAKDLKEAMKNLRSVIKEMDKKIKVQFEETFGFIDKKFQEYFRTIFGGGKAGLKLIKIKSNKNLFPEETVSGEKIDLEEKEMDNEDEDEQETQWGVEISAVPMGKKITSLGMLSGGERTLTSLALLFSVIAHNPPPFAILDEVEAALDEANSERFSRIIRQLSDKTQFVLITHNRQTMKESSLLYGVTMSDDGVSKLLSVKLDEVGENGEIKK